MMCCCDEDLKTDAFHYFSKFIKRLTYISICHFSGNGHPLEINPYVLIDAIIEVISDEKETISNFGVFATETIIQELLMVLEDTVCIESFLCFKTLFHLNIEKICIVLGDPFSFYWLYV